MAIKELVKNRKAFHDYHVEDSLEAGIELRGTEVKSCRGNQITLTDGYAAVENGELWLHNVHISPYNDASMRENHEPNRKRRLLVHRKEIGKLSQATQQKGLTLIPLSVYLKDSRVKVQLGICKGKRQYDKRESIKERESNKRMQQVMRLKG